MPRIEPIPYDELDPELRQRYDAGAAEGRYSITVPLQIYAYAHTYAVAGDEGYKRTFRQGLLGPRIEELLRIRSAQINGCDPCMSSRKDDSISDDDVACMLTSVDDPTYSERERRALRFLDLFNRDHHAIDDDTFRDLAEVFTTAEIVELGQISSRFIGAHRWTHVLGIYDDAEPVLAYDPAQVNASSDADVPA
ncbi:MAG: carboxymuconolactone decarboxylase family protein [Ilumatobacteraceae bacterium]